MNFTRGHALEQEQTISAAVAWEGEQDSEEHPRSHGSGTLTLITWPRTLPCTPLPSSRKVSITNVVGSTGKVR